MPLLASPVPSTGQESAQDYYMSPETSAESMLGPRVEGRR